MSDFVSRNKSGGESDAGSGADVTEFRSKLRRLKRGGCNLLVVGDSSREAFVRASRHMLGDPDARRWRVFALTDASPHSVQRRLPTATAGASLAETTKLIDYELTSRDDAPEIGVPKVTVDGRSLDGLQSELVETVTAFGAQSHGPAQVRVVVDSLAPLLDHHDLDAVRRFLRVVGECVRKNTAMAHYVLPESYDDRCRDLGEEFDAVVELRTPTETVEHTVEERWHLPDANGPTPWVPL